jgi:hypothetical protein
MISAYEQQRLDNISRNQEVLVKLGLAEPPLGVQNPKVLEQPKKPPPPRVPKNQKKEVATRASARAVGRPATYSDGLTDRDFLAEERAIEYAERRRAGGGRTTNPVKRYEPADFPRASKRHRDDERVVAKKTFCRAVTLAVGCQKTVACAVDNKRCVTGTGVAGTGALLPAEIATSDNPQISYYTSGPQGRCPLCQNWFTITGKGKLHKHVCYPRVVTAMPVLPPCVI